MTARGVIASLVLAVAGGCSCGSSGAPDGGLDASSDAPSRRDAGDAAAWRATNPDLGSCTDAGRDRCGCVGDFQRCDTCSSFECPEGSWCTVRGQVCRQEDRHDWDDVCAFRFDGFRSDIDGGGGRPAGDYCSTGRPCAVDADQEGTIESPFSGICMPVDFCLALDEADPPLEEPVECVYSDGTPVVTGPPPDDCPPSDPRQPFCGGACGTDKRCPLVVHDGLFEPDEIPPCVGVSDDRGFGVCAYTKRRCVRGETNLLTLLSCSMYYGEDCACLVPHPQPDEERWQQGFVVLESVCHRYSRAHGEHAECRDSEWELLPD